MAGTPCEDCMKRAKDAGATDQEAREICEGTGDCKPAGSALSNSSISKSINDLKKKPKKPY